MRSRKLTITYIIWMLIFTMIPIVMIGLSAFTDNKGNFTLEPFQKAFFYSNVFVKSLFIALISTVICLILAYPLAYLLTRGIHGTYIGNTGAVIVGMVYEYLPFMVLPIYTVMSKIDPGLIEAAQDLGSNSAAVFGKVIFPLSVPGIISGITMVFVPAASTFLVSQYLGGTDDIMIGDVIDKIFWADQNTGAAISLVLMVFIFVFLVLMNVFGDEEAIA